MSAPSNLVPPSAAPAAADPGAMRDRYLGALFPPRSRVLALPGWRSARLCIPREAGAARRWRASAMYPGNRTAARAVRLLARLKGALGWGRARPIETGGDWPLGAFLRDALPEAATVSVLLKIADSVPRVTVELRDRGGGVVGYVKYAEGRGAARRLEQECTVLSSGLVPDAPRVLKFGPLGDGCALALSPLVGRRFWPVLPPPAGLIAFADRLVRPPPLPLAEHPWVHRMRDETNGASDPLFAQLDTAPWPLAVQHGDLMPSNLYVGAAGKFAACDWEWATLDGFPHLDLLQYVMLVLLILRRQPPSPAAEQAAQWLASRREAGVPLAVARVLTRLAALDRIVNLRRDGMPDAAPEPRLWHAIAAGAG